MDAMTAMRRSLKSFWSQLRSGEQGLTTVEYVLGAGVIVVVVADALLAWNNGLATRIGQLVAQLLS